MPAYSTFSDALTAWRNAMKQIKQVQTSVRSAEDACNQARASQQSGLSQIDSLKATADDAMNQMIQLA